MQAQYKKFWGNGSKQKNSKHDTKSKKKMKYKLVSLEKILGDRENGE